MVQWRNAAVKPPGKGQARRRDRRLRLPPRAGPRARLHGAQGRDRQKGLLDLPHRRGRAARDQRIRFARSPGIGPQGRRPRQQGGRPAARRLDLFRRLDLCGRLRGRGESLQAPRLENRPGGPGSLPELRLDLAQQHARPLQPRLLRSQRQAVSGLEAHRLVGREGEALDRIRHSRRSQISPTARTRPTASAPST